MFQNGVSYSLSFVGVAVVTYYVSMGMISTFLDNGLGIVSLPVTVFGLCCVLLNSFSGDK